MKKRLSCKRIEGSVFIGPNTIKACCLRPGVILADYKGDAIPVQVILDARNKWRRALEQSLPCACSGCSWLEYKDWPDDNEKYLISEEMHICHYQTCNLACNYCSQSDNQKHYHGSVYDFNTVAREIIKNKYLASEAEVHFGSGEPTTMPEFEELLNIFVNETKNNITVVSNGTIFSKKLYDLLHMKRAKVTISLDSATCETFKKIKKKDFFYKVIDNIKKYASDQLIVKYIILPDNSNNEEILGFLNIITQLGKKNVRISTDYIRKPIAPAELDAFAEMLCAAESKNILTPIEDMDHEETLHGYFNYRYEVNNRMQFHRSANRKRNHYKMPSWVKLISDDSLFVAELYFLLTGVYLDEDLCIKLLHELSASLSRFHFVLSCYQKYHISSGLWGRSNIDYSLLWRVYTVLLCRLPKAEDLGVWKDTALSLGDILESTIHSPEFQYCLTLDAKGFCSSDMTRHDVILLYALLLLRAPESERLIIETLCSGSLFLAASNIRNSKEFLGMLDHIVFSRSRPLSEEPLSNYPLKHIVEKFPPWIVSTIAQYTEKTLYEFWREELANFSPSDIKEADSAGTQKKIPPLSVLWFGTGSMAENLLPAIEQEQLEILAFIDERVSMRGAVFSGRPVIALDSIEQYMYDYIFVAARPYEAIRDKLRALEVQEEKIVPLDFEEGSYRIAEQCAELSSCLDIFLEKYSILSTAFNKSKLLDSSWLSSVKARWKTVHTANNVSLLSPKLSASGQFVSLAVRLPGGVGDVLIATAWLKEFYKYSPSGLQIDVFTNDRAIFPLYLQSYIRNIFPIDQYEYMNRYDLKFSIMHFVVIDKQLSIAMQHKFPSLYKITSSLNSFAQKYSQYAYYQPLHNGSWANLCMVRGLKRWDELGLSNAVLFGQGSWAAVHFQLEAFSALQGFGIEGKPFVTVHAGADVRVADNKSVKIWPKKNWERFCQLFKENYPDVLLVQLGAKGISEIAGVDFSLVGKTTLHESAAILKQALLHIDGESGLVHLRRQMGGRSVVLFGPTPVGYYGYDQNSNIVSPAACTNCMWLTSDWYEACPRGLTEPECMSAISPERVLQSVKNSLELHCKYSYELSDISLYSTKSRVEYEPMLISVCNECNLEQKSIANSIYGDVRTYIHPSKQWEYPYVINRINEIGMPSLKIADVGGGRGVLSWYLATQGHTVTVYDIDFLWDAGNEVDVERRFMQMAIANGFSAEFGSTFNIPADDNTFDVVTSVSVVEHVPWKKYAFKEMLRVLKPGGKLIVTYDLIPDTFQGEHGRLEVFTPQGIVDVLNEFCPFRSPVYSAEAIQASVADTVADRVRGLAVGMTVGGFVITKAATVF